MEDNKLFQLYKEALREKIRYITFDQMTGERFEFEKLFFPLEIAEGRYAFQKYNEQMEKARSSRGKAEKGDTSRAQLAKEIISKTHSLISEISHKSVENGKATSLTSVNPPEPEVRARQTLTISDLQIDNENSKSDFGDIEQKDNGSAQLIEEENRVNSERIRGKIANYQETTKKEYIQENNSEFAEQVENDDLLLVERGNGIDPSSLIIRGRKSSRVLVIASAGHGKTTLLNRVALHYCSDKPGSATDAQIVARKYGLEGNYIPCIMRLRDLSDTLLDIQSIIENCVKDVLKTTGKYLNKEEIREWVSNNLSDFLILIDGLDELSNESRPLFLLSLEQFLNNNPKTSVIMSSRVAGLSEQGVEECLNRMRFHGRSLLPLTDKEAHDYAVKWIDETQPAEQKKILLSAVMQVLDQEKYEYLREFMRTPLEMIVILNQIANNTLSLNRYQLFHDMLWEVITRHIKSYSQKRPAFDDAMTILGFIAYHMQINGTLIISVDNLSQLVGDLGRFSFHTNIVKNGSVEDYIEILNAFAANVGIIEKDDRYSEIAYTFPIRAYQEFLTAYACCHLRLNESYSRPNAVSIIRNYSTDSRWLNVTNFALADLCVNNQADFDRLIKDLFESTTECGSLKSIVEADLPVTRDHALVLCEKQFSKNCLTPSEKELLYSCMKTRSAYAYVYALQILYQRNKLETNNYIEAMALAKAIWDYDTTKSAVKTATKLINGETIHEIKLGAQLITILARCINEEELEEYRVKVVNDLIITTEMISFLEDNAKRYKDYYSIEALASLWTTNIKGSDSVREALTSELAKIVINHLDQKEDIIQWLCVKNNALQNYAEFYELEAIIYTLGSFPISKELAINEGKNIYVISFLNAFYQKTKDSLELNQVAVSIACLYYCWNFDDDFMGRWVDDICRWVPSEYVRKDNCYQREQNLFVLVRGNLSRAEKKYKEQHINDLNPYNRLKSVFSLFREEKYFEAAKYCLETMGQEPASNKTNLAFLLRYAKLDPAKLVDDPSKISIDYLLQEGVENGESYALVNMALQQIERGDYRTADKLFRRVTPEGWIDVTNNFWLEELWKAKRDPEGAFICVLASKYGKCKFTDLDEMEDTVKKHYKGAEPLMLMDK